MYENACQSIVLFLLKLPFQKKSLDNLTIRNYDRFCWPNIVIIKEDQPKKKKRIQKLFDWREAKYFSADHVGWNMGYLYDMLNLAEYLMEPERLINALKERGLFNLGKGNLKNVWYQ